MSTCASQLRGNLDWLSWCLAHSPSAPLLDSSPKREAEDASKRKRTIVLQQRKVIPSLILLPN